MTVRVSRDRRAGKILLDRPQALNALDLPMIQAVADAVAAFEADPSVHVITVQGAGRAFCAGGDIRGVYAAARAGDWDAIEAFFAAEYALNRQIAECRTPYVALVDGLCMGGGVGAAIHGPARVATQAASFAMPETGIGFFPDVGTSFLLPRMAGALGFYLGLTGARLAGADAVHAGFATHFCQRERLGALAEALAADGFTALAGFAEALPPFTLDRGPIDAAFSAQDVPELFARLRADGSAFAQETLAALERASPSALCWTHALLTRGAGLDLRGCLAMELRLSRAVARHPDMAEGVRAAVIDKDRAPKWSPARLGDVDATASAAMAAALAPPPG